MVRWVQFSNNGFMITVLCVFFYKYIFSGLPAGSPMGNKYEYSK